MAERKRSANLAVEDTASPDADNLGAISPLVTSNSTRKRTYKHQVSMAGSMASHDSFFSRSVKKNNVWQGFAGTSSSLTAEETCTAPKTSDYWLVLKTSTKANLKLMRKRVHTWIIPLLLFLSLAASGIVAVNYASSSYEDKERSEAQTIAQTAASAYETDFARSYMPCITLGMIVKEDPNYVHLTANFDSIVDALYDTGTLHPHTLNMQLAPNSIVQNISPNGAHHKALGHNLLFDDRRRKDALKTIRNRELTLSGPFQTVQGFFAALARYPVWIENVEDPGEDFNVPGAMCPVTQEEPVLPFITTTMGTCVGPHTCLEGEDDEKAAGETCYGPFDCTQRDLTADTACKGSYNCFDDDGTDVCYDAEKKEKFWGFTTAFIHFDRATEQSRLSTVSNAGYVYQLRRPNEDLGNQVIASSMANYTMSSSALSADISVPGNTWTLDVELPGGNWRPEWEPWLYATVVVSAAVLSALLCAMLISRAHHHALLNAMLPKMVIKQLQQGRRVLKGFENVTVLFSDIVSYTDMSTRISPVEISTLLDEVYSEFDDITDRYNLYKLDTIGDAFMCVGGCPEKCDPVDAATRVAKCALDMIEAAAKIKSPEGHAISIRIGLHSGPVVTGVLGRKVPKYTLYGDTVNTASRMESKGQARRVHLSHATTLLLLQGHGDFKIQHRGAIEVKGKGRMSTFWLDGSDGTPMEASEQLRLRTLCENEMNMQRAKTMRQASRMSTNLTAEHRQMTRFSVEGAIVVNNPVGMDTMGSRASSQELDRQCQSGLSSTFSENHLIHPPINEEHIREDEVDLTEDITGEITEDMAGDAQFTDTLNSIEVKDLEVGLMRRNSP